MQKCRTFDLSDYRSVGLSIRTQGLRRGVEVYGTFINYLNPTAPAVRYEFDKLTNTSCLFRK